MEREILSPMGINRPAFDAIIFDAEGVVIDTEPLWDEAQRMLLERRGIQYDRDRVKHLIAGKSGLDGIAVLQREFNIAGDPASLAAERTADVRELIAERVRFIPGFEDFFALTRERYKTCIATSMQDDLLAIVRQRLHLDSLFGDRIFSISDVGNRSKPDPALFLYASEKLSTPPARCVVIEDSPNGLQAARRANMYSIGLATTFPPPALKDANEIASSYEDLARTFAVSKHLEQAVK
jgi:beta-phosphoglucomutase